MSRRGENIYKRKDGRWEGRYIKSHEKGKIHYGYVYAKSYREVKQKILTSAQNPIVSIEQATPDKPSEVFSDTALEWLSVSRNQLKESSYVKYSTIVNKHLLPVFGNRSISNITRDDVSQFCNQLLSEENNTPTLSPKTVSCIICVLKNIFDYAAQIKQYTTVDLRGISIRQPQHQLRILSLSEQQRLNEYLCENLSKNRTKTNIQVNLIKKNDEWQIIRNDEYNTAVTGDAVTSYRELMKLIYEEDLA